MRELVFSFETNLYFSQPVTNHSFLLRCIPTQNEEQSLLSYMLDISPHDGSLACSRDGFGNVTHSGHIAADHSFFSYRVTGRVCRDDSRKALCEPQPYYKYSSALTAVTPELEKFLASIDLSGSQQDRVWQVAKAVHKHFCYMPGTTGVQTMASDAFRQQSGVCQDYTHVFITLLRLMGVPARYVSGLPLGDGASHAWTEAWIEGLWQGIDCTRDCPADEGYIKLCVGRDFADCPLERGVFCGMADQQQSSYMKVEEWK